MGVMMENNDGRPGGLSSFGSSQQAVSPLRASIPDALVHYAKHPVAFEPREYVQCERGSPFGKPRGLWLNVEGEDDWPSWCRSEEFHLEGLGYAHAATISPDARILWLKTVGDFDVFEGQYARVKDDKWRSKHIDWLAVTQDYDGIFIAPYQWSERLERDWYYGWDCASGCVWNTSVVTLAQGMSASGQDGNRLEAKPASPVACDAPNTSGDSQ